MHDGGEAKTGTIEVGAFIGSSKLIPCGAIKNRGFGDSCGSFARGRTAGEQSCEPSEWVADVNVVVDVDFDGDGDGVRERRS